MEDLRVGWTRISMRNALRPAFDPPFDRLDTAEAEGALTGWRHL